MRFPSLLYYSLRSRRLRSDKEGYLARTRLDAYVGYLVYYETYWPVEKGCFYDWISLLHAPYLGEDPITKVLI